jgi:hypothetical protein
MLFYRLGRGLRGKRAVADGAGLAITLEQQSETRRSGAVSKREQPTTRSLMGPNSNPNAGPLLAWLHDHEVKDRISHTADT